MPAMRARSVSDPAEFLRLASPLLLADEARHNLILGLAGILVNAPAAYPDFHLWIADDDGGVIAGAALVTLPHNIVLAQPANAAALAALAEIAAADYPDAPGVVGADPEADDFAALWHSSTGDTANVAMNSRIYALTSVNAVAGVPGRARTATQRDRQLLVEWVTAFSHELGEAHSTPDNAERVVDMRLGQRDAGYMIWENGGPVALAGFGGFTPTGARIGPVYTPPKHRRLGYGQAVTAAVTSRLLAGGRSHCFLYTDAANPTSNHIYQEIGYEAVCESRHIEFKRA